MAVRPERLVQYVRRLASRQAPSPDSDAALLDCFVRRRDEDAFAALVSRHGQLVLDVCRRVLRDEHRAEDAAQAVFVVLARKAATIRPSDRLAAWLHGAARQVARNARRAEMRRRQREARAARSPATRAQPDPLDQVTAREFLQILDDELYRLPEVYRLPLILCALESHTVDEAAAQLGCTPGSVRGHLIRGRERLHARLLRRGLTLSAVLLALESKHGVPAAGRSTTWTTAALQYAAHNRGVSAEAAVLAEQALKSTTGAGWKLALLLLVGGVLTAAVGTGDRPTAPHAPPSDAVHLVPGEGRDLRADRDGNSLPPGALARLGTVYWRHVDGVWGLVFSRDGRQVVTADAGVIRLWETASGRPRLSIDSGDPRYWLHWPPVLSPDGTVLATAGRSRDPIHLQGSVRLWRFPSGTPLLRIHLPEWALAAVAFSADGKRVITATQEGAMHVWDAATGKELHHFPGGRQAFASVELSADGKILATVGDGGVLFWDSTNGKQVGRISNKEYDNLHCLTFAPNDKTVAGVVDRSPGREKRVVLWDIATGKEQRHFKFPAATHNMWGGSIAFTPDGQTLAASANDGSLSLWNVATGQRQRTISGVSDQLWHLAFSPDGKILAGGAFYHSVVLWDVATGRELAGAREGHRSSVSQVLFTPEGKTLVSTSADDTIRLWDPTTGRQRLVVQQKWIEGLAVSPDGRLLASSSADDSVRLWEAATGKQLRQLPGHGWTGGARPLAFSADGRTLASWGEDWQLRVWEVRTGKELFHGEPHLTGVPELPPLTQLQRRHVELERRRCCPAPAFTPDGRTLLILTLQATHVVDVATGLETFTLPTHPITRSNPLAVSPDGRLLALATQDREGLLVELASGKVVLRLKDIEEGTELTFAPDGRRLAANLGWNNGTLALWDVRTGRRLLTRQSPAPASALAFAPDGRTLAAGLRDTTTLIWDVSSASPPDSPVPSDQDLAPAWRTLASDDAGQAYAAIWVLVAAADRGVALLREHLQPDRGEDRKRLRQILADLDSKQFNVRESAAGKLASFGPELRPLLRRALADTSPLEVHKRIEQVLAQPAGAIRDPEVLQAIRAIQALEAIGTRGARQVLEALAQGVSDARRTEEAKASLRRLDARQTQVRPATGPR